MRLRLLIFFSLGVTLVNFAQSNHETILSSAQQHFENKNYNKTIELYEGLIEEGYNSTDLHFNLATAYFENNKLAHSILYYEKVLKKKPYSKAVNTNLKIANDLRASDISPIPDFFLLQWWKNFSKLLGSTIWSLLAFLLFAGSLYFLWQYLLKHSRRRFLTSTVLLALFGLLFLLVARTSHQLSYNENHLINLKELSILQGPDKNADIEMEIPAGEKLKIEDRIGDWIKVSLINRDEGWINESDAVSI